MLRRCCFAAYYTRSMDELSGPRHRDGRAGSTILQLVSAFYDRNKALISDYGPDGAAGAWATPPHPPGPQDRLRDYGPDEAAGSRRRAVGTTGPFQGLRADREQRTPPSIPPGLQYLPKNYGPDGSAGWLCRSTPRQADESNTRPFGSGPTRQFDARDIESSFYTPIDRRGLGPSRGHQ